MKGQYELSKTVTIVTITYNLVKNGRTDYIRECIESVHNQSYPFIEHIVIDGASDDGTLEILKEYEQNGYLKIYSEPDNGVYDAMNKGIAKAHGEYITFLNSDDFYYDPKGIETSVNFLDENKADYSFADVLVRGENGVEYIWTGDETRILLGNHYCHQSMLMRTKLLRDMGGFDLSYKIAADTDLMVRLLAEKRKFVKVPSKLVLYRLGGVSCFDQTLSRKEHAAAFYRHIGKNIGLTQDECFLLCWNPLLFEEQSLECLQELILKLPNEYGRKWLLYELIKKYKDLSVILDNQKRERTSSDCPNLQNKIIKYYLLGIPLKYKTLQNGKKLYLFRILLCRIKVNERKKKYYLFGFIPFLKVRYKHVD